MKAAYVVGFTGCALAVILAILAMNKGTKAHGPYSLHSTDSHESKQSIESAAKQGSMVSSETMDKQVIHDDGKQPDDPPKDLGFQRKKLPFGTKSKAPQGKVLLETKRPFVKSWKVDDLLKKLEKGLTHRDFDRGKKLYAEVKCVLCHTYGQDEGGFIGPALTDVGARFSAADILYSIIEPNKVIADAYAQRIVELEDGRVFTGIVAQPDDEVQITQDILDPDRKIVVTQDQVTSIRKSEISPMPEGLINTLNEDEILDLIAFVISRNDREDEMFEPLGKNK